MKLCVLVIDIEKSALDRKVGTEKMAAGSMHTMKLAQGTPKIAPFPFLSSGPQEQMKAP